MKKRLLSVLLPLCMMLCLVPFTVFAEGETGVAINQTNFPDTVFRNIVNGFDTDGNGYLSDAEIAAVTKITCNGKGISDLTGIGYFTAVTWLACDKNQLTSLDVSKNTALAMLICDQNQLTSLDLSKNTTLADFFCYNNAYQIVIGEDRTFDLSTLPGSFNVSKAGNWNGGTVNGNILTVDNDKNTVTYSYDCGRAGYSTNFTLKCITSYTVSFNTNGGNDIASQTIVHGEKAIMPDNPVKPGYIFTDWYTDEFCTKNYDFDTPVTTSITLYAGWTECDHSGSTMQPTCTNPATCTVCGGTIAALGHDWDRKWKHNATHHWHECLHVNCDMKDSYAVHTGGTATCTTRAVCDLCHQPYGEENPANHKGGVKQWIKTATTHKEKWSCCGTCIVPESIHNWVDGICQDCGYACSHVDADKDHICDYCGMTISDHVDTDKDHVCDYCGMTISKHIDADKDHVCDYCGMSISKHIDADKDHVCDYCGMSISKHADANKDHICDYCGKTISSHTGGKATCKNKAKCEICGKTYGKLDPTNHADLRHINATAATKEADGNIEYWYCEGCNKYYNDKDGTKEIKKADTITAKLKEDSKLSYPRTGDTSNLTLYFALLVISGIAIISIAIISKKRKAS